MDSKAIIFALLLTGISGGRAQTAATVPAANPGRPTVSTPATLTPVGYLQFENGVLFAQDSTEFSNRWGINQVTKLTFHPRLQLILQLEPLVYSAVAKREFDKGGVSAGLQAVLVPGHGRRPTLAVSYFHSLYSGTAPDIDIGSSNQSALFLLSEDLWGFHLDANGIALEQAEGRVRRAQFGQTLSISHPLKKVTISGEVWHFSQPLLRGNTVGNLWEVSYPLRENLVLDIGMNRGLTSSSTRWEGIMGFTYVLPHRLWKERKPR